MKAKKVAILLVLAVSLTLLGGCDESEPVESTPVEASGTESAQSDTVPRSDVTLPDDVITVETPTSGESADPDDTQCGDDAQDAGESEHTHTWVDETRYNTVHHDAVTHTEQVTVIDQAAWDETVTTYTTETQTIHHDAVTHTVDCYTCRDCGAQFTDLGAALAHQEANDHDSGLISDSTTVVDQAAWDETVYVQVPHTEIVHHDAITHVETKTVIDKEAYDEQVPYTVTVCSECGKEKE